MLKTLSIILKLIILSTLLQACSSQLMNGHTYSQISIGMSAAEARLIAGEPSRVIQNSSYQNYEYVERFEVGPQNIHQNIYILSVKNGVIIDKQKINNTSPISFSTP